MKAKMSNSWLPHIGLLYLLPAFLWWAFLLWNKNEEVYTLQHATVNLTSRTFTEAEVSEQHAKIEARHQRQRRMILAEGFVFLLLLGWGLQRIRSSFKREVELAKQQRNFQLSVTHELKSPIAAIQLGMETLLRRDFAPDKTRKILSNGLRDTKRLNKLVEDILLSASLEDVWKPNKEAVDLAGFVEDLVADMQRIYPELSVVDKIEKGLPLLEIDALAFRAVLSNLLENSVKYKSDTPPVCTITIRELEDEKIEIQVADNGMGIPNHEKKRVFDKFYRIGNEDTRNAKGTGLGLYIVNKVIQAHNGTVEIQDNQPKGTIFNITI